MDDRQLTFSANTHGLPCLRIQDQLDRSWSKNYTRWFRWGDLTNPETSRFALIPFLFSSPGRVDEVTML